ncbi:hypothetical protein ACPA9J_23275 [Pseudomonas aeruginosa]
MRREANCWCNPSRQAQGSWATASASQLFGGGNAASPGTGGASHTAGRTSLGRGRTRQRLLRLGVALAPLLLGLRKRRGR